MKENRSRMTQVLTLLCLTVFALCILLVLLSSASLYRDLVVSGENAYARRTALQYLTTRVRQAETVETGALGDCDALVLTQTVDGECYTTHIYCYEGWLRELLAVPGAVLPPQAGEKVLEAEKFSLKQEDDLLTVTFGEDTLFLQIPTETEVLQ